MPRPQKQTVEYFSHDAGAGDGRTLSILFNHFGHEGISAWWLLLEQLAKTRNHIISIRNPEDIEFMSAKLHFKPERLLEIFTKMAELNAIDVDLFKAGQLWSQNFVDRLEPVYKVRKQALPTKPELSVPETPLSIPETTLSVSETTQSKESKVKRVNYSKERKPDSSNNEVPDWLNKDVWLAFLEMRKLKRAFPTERAKELLLKELERLKSAGDDPNEVLNQSIMRNYTGVFPLSKGGQSGAHRENTKPGIPGNRPAGAFADLENRD